MKQTLLAWGIIVLLTACGAAETSAGDGPSPTPGDAAADSPIGPINPPEPPPNRPIPEPGQLTAGEWRDLDNWEFWLNLMNNQEWSARQTYWGFETTQKVSVVVQNNDVEIADAHLQLLDQQDRVLWEARSDNQGRAVLFPELFDSAIRPYTLEITVDDETVRIDDVALNTDQPIIVNVQTQPTSNALDLMFVIDTTGSMGDELEYLKVELQDVIARVQQDQANLDIRLSANYYRDDDDVYVVRSFPFSNNIPEVIAQVGQQRASGGGDYPEAVDQALQDAIEDHDWREDAKARLLFLVLDAPPHYRQDAVGRVQAMTRQAAAKGIRIIPLASSGVDKDTEFLLRFMSIATDGSYTFLTNDSGIGDDKIEPTIGAYQVEFLNDLLVRIITRYVE
ncbi:MAG: vWA domain-containing protein [Deinococcota bacterium]